MSLEFKLNIDKLTSNTKGLADCLKTAQKDVTNLQTETRTLMDTKQDLNEYLDHRSVMQKQLT